MFIPYDKIGQTLALFFSARFSNLIKEFFNDIKIETNCKYIEKNSKKVIEKLRKEVKYRKLRVAFLCFERTKWKNQTLYDLFLQSEYFEPFILASKYSDSAGIHAAIPMSAENVKRTYEFFSDKGLETYYAYDINNKQFIPIKQFKPDIIFYQEPWYNETSQGPVVASKFALTCYVPYFVANVKSDVEYGLRFHRYIHKHYILNDLVRDFYSKNMKNHGKNLVVTGHPQLDYFYLNKQKLLNNKKDFVIYAPHWSINYLRVNYATFVWNGRYILEFAKKHPEINWVFKPHPALKRRLQTQNIMTPEEIEKYWDDWDKIGLKYETGDYLDIFSNSYAMITDCGSFLTEYLLTGQPVIHLISETSAGYNPSAESIVENYYKARNIEELEFLMDKILLKKYDTMKAQRLKYIENSKFINTYAAQNILNDLKQELNIE